MTSTNMCLKLTQESYMDRSRPLDSHSIDGISGLILSSLSFNKSTRRSSNWENRRQPGWNWRENRKRWKKLRSKKSQRLQKQASQASGTGSIGIWIGRLKKSVLKKSKRRRKRSKNERRNCWPRKRRCHRHLKQILNQHSFLKIGILVSLNKSCIMYRIRTKINCRKWNLCLNQNWRFQLEWSSMQLNNIALG